MRVVCCSSGCCGIKHIRDFFYSPEEIIRLRESEGHEEDTYTTEPSAYAQVTPIDEDTADYYPSYEVLKILVEKTKRYRPSGMITVNLESTIEIDDDYDTEYIDHGKVDAWRPYLTDLGFTETTFTNSNSGNIVHHFVLIYKED